MVNVVGKRGIFKPQSYGEWYWDDARLAEIAKEYDGCEFEITSVEIDNGNFEDSCFNIRFEDGLEVYCISSYEFDLFEDGE